MGVVQLMRDMSFAGLRYMGGCVFVMVYTPRQGNKPVWDMRICAKVAEQHNKGVVTRREEFPRDGQNVVTWTLLKRLKQARRRDFLTTQPNEKVHSLGNKVFMFLPTSSNSSSGGKRSTHSPLLTKQISNRERGNQFLQRVANLKIFSLSASTSEVVKLRNEVTLYGLVCVVGMLIWSICPPWGNKQVCPLVIMIIFLYIPIN